MNDFDDEMLDFAERLVQRSAAREQRLRQLGLNRQEQQRFDEEEMGMQARREEKQMLQQQQAQSTNSPSKAHMISFSKQLQSTDNSTGPSCSKSSASPVKHFTTPSSPLKTAPLCTPSKSSSPVKSYAPSPLRPHNFVASPLKPSVFTPPKIDLRSIKPVEFSPSTLQATTKSPIRSVGFSPSHKPASPALSTFNQSPKPFGSAQSPVKQLIEEQEREEEQLKRRSPETKDRTDKTDEPMDTNQSSQHPHFGLIDPPEVKSSSQITKLRSTIDSECKSETGVTPTPTPSFISSNLKNALHCNSSVKARARLFETDLTMTNDGSKPPERMCVSDKKKLFESAIKRESENAKRNHEQRMFLSRGKNLFQQGQDDHDFDVKKRKENEGESIVESSEEKMAVEPQEENEQLNLEPEQVMVEDEEAEVNQQPPPSSVATASASSINVTCDKSSLSIVSIPPPMPIISGYLDKNSSPPLSTESVNTGRKLNIEEMKQRLQQKLYGSEEISPTSSVTLSPAPSPIKGRLSLDRESSPVKISVLSVSPKQSAELYPKLHSVREEPIIIEGLPATMVCGIEQDIQRLNELSKDKKGDPKLESARSSTNKPVTPIRTLSMYRREQKVRAAQNVTPSRAIRPSEDAIDRPMMRQLWRQQLRDKINAMKKDIEQYDVVMAQTTNAVTLCLKTGEFRGSMEQLEAEKILLVTTKRRLACQKEIARLAELLNKDMASNDPISEFLEKPTANGCIVINSISVPLQSEFIVNQVSEQDPLNHYVLCVFTCGEKVMQTKLLSSSTSILKGAFWFDDELTFNELDNHFELKLEFYAMALPRDKSGSHCPASSQDRRSNLLQSMKITPRSPRPKSKKHAAPSFNYSSNEGFTRLGMIKLDMSNMAYKRHELDEPTLHTPLEGFAEIKCQMQASYDIEMRDYLNFFEETGGYSVWNRRWCVLKGYYLAYWRFAEDEQSKHSLGVIDLRQCVSPQIGPVTYELCARKNTFLMVCIQPKESDGTQDKSPLKVKPHKTMIAKKHLISADLKEEMDVWCKNLNQVLENVRLWESNCLQPYESSQLDRLIRH